MGQTRRLQTFRTSEKGGLLPLRDSRSRSSRGVRVNAVAPELVKTTSVANMLGSQEAAEQPYERALTTPRWSSSCGDQAPSSSRPGLIYAKGGLYVAKRRPSGERRDVSGCTFFRVTDRSPAASNCFRARGWNLDIRIR